MSIFERLRRTTRRGAELRDDIMRTVRVGLEAGLVGDALSGVAPSGLGLAVREGLSLRTAHALHARQHPQRAAVVDEDRRVDYASFDDEINRLARAVTDEIPAPSSSPLVVMMHNRVEYLAAWFAGVRMARPVVHASWRSTPDELAYLLDHSEARLICTDAERLEVARQARERAERDVEIVVVGADSLDEHEWDYRELVDGASGDFFSASEGDAGDNVVYTSGTTGRPKGTLRNWSSYGIAHLMRLLERLPMRAGDRHMIVSPLYHSGGQVFAVLTASLGGTAFLRPTFEAEDALRHLSQYAIHHAFMVPTMIRRILELDDELHERWPTPELRAIISGAAPFPDALRRRAIERFGAERIFDFYGATELGWVTTIRGDEMLEREGSVGRPLPGQTIRITDEEGRELPAAEVGIIRIRGEQSMRGYLRDEEATRASGLGDDDAWVTVEDMGYVDEDGYLYLAGRARDMVISGGVNIYPAEIEEAYGHHEAIADIAVVGVPHEEWGEELVGFVVPREDTDPPQTESLEDWGRERLASYKIPRSWVFVDELPRNPTGKVLKNELRERYEKSPESS